LSTDFFLARAGEPEDFRPRRVARTYWGGVVRGCVVELLSELSDDDEVVDEYGRRLTVAELRAKDGAGREAPE